MISDKYIHSKVEDKIYAYWEKNKLFKPKKSKFKKSFSVVIPPPNITGRLHMGHALNNSLQDVLVRYYRMKGFETLWQPGTDHAGIATQAVVEKNLQEDGINKDTFTNLLIDHIFDTLVFSKKFVLVNYLYSVDTSDVLVKSLKDKDLLNFSF